MGTRRDDVLVRSQARTEPIAGQDKSICEYTLEGDNNQIKPILFISSY
jgi:hypothetical protein